MMIPIIVFAKAIAGSLSRGTGSMSLLLQLLLGANVDGSGSSFHEDGRTSRDKGSNLPMDLSRKGRLLEKQHGGGGGAPGELEDGCWGTFLLSDSPICRVEREKVGVVGDSVAAGRRNGDSEPDLPSPTPPDMRIGP
jgi:hypothetical protein